MEHVALAALEQRVLQEYSMASKAQVIFSFILATAARLYSQKESHVHRIEAKGIGEELSKEAEALRSFPFYKELKVIGLRRRYDRILQIHPRQ